ncbi:MAG: ABC transporter permease [Blastocatellia bacterium]|nr:ABC transporter permease [Blastocatellia bacterium]
MTWLRVLIQRLRGLLLKRRLEQELEEEIRSHLDLQIEDNQRQGMSPDEAQSVALRKFGGVEQIKEVYRDHRGLPLVETIFQDLRYGMRMLLSHKSFTVVAVLTLALGIGANTAIFGVVNAVLLRSLPFKEPERLVMVWNRGSEVIGGDRSSLAVADLLDWRAQSRSFAYMEAFETVTLNYTGGESPERVRVARVTAKFFSMLGVLPSLGGSFSPDEERPGSQRVVLLSDGFWRKYLAADPQAVGRAIKLNDVSYTIIGVMPAALNFPDKRVELWVAMQSQPPTRRGPFFLTGVARLKSDVSLNQARAEMKALKSSFEGELVFNILPINEFIVGDVRLALLVLLGAVTFVLLIAAVNVANLMLMRSAARVKEISIRAALGAGRARIIRQLLTESLLLALAGGLLGLLLALWGGDLLLKMAPEGIPRLDQVGLDGRVLGWTALVSLVTGLLFGLAPAWQSSRLNLNEALKEGGRSVTESRGKRRWRDLLVVSELALAVMLLIGAGLLVKSFWRLLHVDPGVKSEGVLTMQFALRGQRYADRRQIDAFYPQLLARVQALPGVRAAAVSTGLPPDGPGYSDDFTIEGRPVGQNHIPQIANVIHVSQDYFGTLGIQLHRGRYFSAADSAAAPPVLILNETTARQFFPNEDPIGKRINIHSVWRQIVGVVGDVKYNGPAAETQPAFYLPLIQDPLPSVVLIVKTEAADPLSLAPAVRNGIRSLDRELPVAGVRTLEQGFASAVARPRFSAILIALFAALALILASVGIYGVISYSVAQRRHEMGVRIALGARSRDVLKLVVRQGMKLAVIGVALGLISSFVLTRLMKTLLFSVSVTDVTTFVLIPLLLAIVALVACYIPARRATKVDPLIALRSG